MEQARRSLGALRAISTYASLIAAVLVAVLTLQTKPLVLADTPPPGSIPIKFINHADYPIEVFWVNVNMKPTAPDSERLVVQSAKPIRNSSDLRINSYKSHVFRVRYRNGSPSNATVDIVKGPKEEDAVITFDGSAFRVDQVTPFDKTVTSLRQAMDRCGHPGRDGYVECIAQEVHGETERIRTHNTAITRSLDRVSSHLRNYSCADETRTTSPSVGSRMLRVKGEAAPMQLETLLDTTHAKIWYVPDFVSREQCAILKKHGKPRLVRATVAAEDGSSVVSEHRKAQQASYGLFVNNPKDPLFGLFKKVYATANELTGFGLQMEGQEDFTIIQYNVNDEYTPHCDGACDNTKHNVAGRVATAVLYCDMPPRGGAIMFNNADLFVIPEPGTAVFFSYMGADEVMDSGLTEHSSCPVLEGEKWIATAWMRKGVTREKPWTMYDPSGGLLMEPRNMNGYKNDVEEEGEDASATTSTTTTTTDAAEESVTEDEPMGFEDGYDGYNNAEL